MKPMEESDYLIRNGVYCFIKCVCYINNETKINVFGCFYSTEVSFVENRKNYRFGFMNYCSAGVPSFQ